MNLPGFENITGLTDDAVHRQHDFVAFISEGKVLSKDIEKHFGWPDSTVRALSNYLRRQGTAVCADSKGYFIAESVADVDKQIDSLRGRVKSIEAAIDGLLQTRNVMLYGEVKQTTLELEAE